MDSNQPPVPPQAQFKEKALNAKFSYSFTRRQLIVLVNVLRPIQLPLGDLRNRVLIEILDEIERTAISSILPNDYEMPAKGQGNPPTIPLDNGVKTN